MVARLYSALQVPGESLHFAEESLAIAGRLHRLPHRQRH